MQATIKRAGRRAELVACLWEGGTGLPDGEDGGEQEGPNWRCGVAVRIVKTVGTVSPVHNANVLMNSLSHVGRPETVGRVEECPRAVSVDISRDRVCGLICRTTGDLRGAPVRMPFCK